MKEVRNRCPREKNPHKICKYWWAEKSECMRMTADLQKKGVTGFHAVQTGRKCLGILSACFYDDYSLRQQADPEKIKNDGCVRCTTVG